jgi:hypothetical protein
MKASGRTDMPTHRKSSPENQSPKNQSSDSRNIAKDSEKGKAVGRKRPIIEAAPLTDQTWWQFRVRLAAALGDLSEDEYLVISYKFADYFVQFAAQGPHGMRVEAVSNTYIDEHARLLQRAYQLLLTLGWNAPTYVPAEGVPEPADGSPNFYLDAAVPVPYATLASLAVATLRRVYGVRHPGELEYSAYSDSETSIRFPLLGIKRCDT